MAIWNPWHGCHKLSEGCRHCYIYSGDKRRGVDTTMVTKTPNFDLPIRKNKKGEYKISAGKTVYTCFSSDFFIKEADIWRDEVWSMIRDRGDLRFLIITKRIDRFIDCIPDDWGDGYEHVTICCTVENQACADYRLPIYKAAPIKHKIIVCAPLLEKIDISRYVDSSIEQITVGGESGPDARVCDLEWILQLRALCVERNIAFWFKETGSKLLKEGHLYRIPYRLQHSQARKSGLNIDTEYRKSAL